MSAFVALPENGSRVPADSLDLAAGAHREHGFAKRPRSQRVQELVDGDFS